MSQAPKGFSRLASQRLVLYESSLDYQPGVGQVLVWPSGLSAHPQSPIRSITVDTVRPTGLWVDSNGDLWVVNIPQGAPTTGIFVYHPGAFIPFRHITDSLVTPGEVAVAKDGTAYVHQSECNNFQGDCISVYAPGSNIASHTILTGITGYAHIAGGLAFAKNGNLLAFESSFRQGAHVFSIDRNTLHVHDLNLHLTVDGPGLATDGTGNLYITGVGAGAIDVFAPGATSPSRVLSGGGYDITALSDGTLYVNGYGSVSEYAPGASSPTNVITSYGNYGTGVAVGPAR